jgi:transposase
VRAGYVRALRADARLLPLLDARTVLYKTYLKLDNAVKAVVRHDPICQRLMTVPGVGPVTSLTFKAGSTMPTASARHARSQRTSG